MFTTYQAKLLEKFIRGEVDVALDQKYGTLKKNMKLFYFALNFVCSIAIQFVNKLLFAVFNFQFGKLWYISSDLHF